MHFKNFALFTIVLFVSIEVASSQLLPDDILDSIPEIDINDAELQRIMKEELQKMKMDLTKGFLEEHTRLKRESGSGTFNYEVKLSDQVTSMSFQTKISTNIGHSITMFKGSPFVFQEDGIFKLVVSTHSMDLVKASTWRLTPGDIILNSFEWEDKLFILTSSKNGSFSQLFTYQELDNAEPISRQHIRNQGYITSAQFFRHGKELYLVTAVDNEVHALASSPIYRWAGTYMDQIHEIRTRGASAVETFSIGTFKYIAIAQKQDSAGNAEVGTLIVRMFRGGEIERFQLLWSMSPITLKHIKFLQEEFLVIGQPENSIVYWFGGYEFLDWQSLEGFPGSDSHGSLNIFLDGFVWEGEPVLLAASEKDVSFFTRTIGASTNQQQLSASKLIMTSTLFSTKATETILDAKIVQLSPDEPAVSITVHSTSSRGVSLRILPLTIAREEIPESHIKETEEKLSNCMVTLGTLLTSHDPFVTRFEKEGDEVLTVDKAWTYTGQIRTSGKVSIVDESSSNLGTVEVKPLLSSLEDGYENTPSKTLAIAEAQKQSFANKIQAQLDNVLLRSKESEITGQLKFTKSLEIDKLEAAESNLQLLTLNGVAWNTLENEILLSNNDSKPQLITGEWNVGNLNADLVQIYNGFDSDFLMTSCSSNQQDQIVESEFEFKRNLSFDNLYIEESASINGIKFSNIAFKSDNVREIEGYKIAATINGGDGVQIEKWNDIKLSEWYDSTLKAVSLEEQFFSGILEFTGDLSISNLQVKHLNSRDWNEFKDSVLLDFGDQTVRSDLSFQTLKVNHLVTEKVNGQDISQLLSTTSDQEVTSEITVANTLRIRKNLNAGAEDGLINGIHLTDAVNDQEDVTITGPIDFKKLTVFKNIHTNEGVTINDVDISEAAKQRKKYIYFTKDESQLISLEGNIQATDLRSDSLNGIAFDEIKSSFWSSKYSNSIDTDFDLSGASQIVVEQFHTGTLNGLDLDTDIVSTNKDDEQIFARLQFQAPVVVQGDVEMGYGIEINGIDFSSTYDKIVKTNKAKKIYGKKFFKDDLSIEGGLVVKKINGISLEDDLVYLESASNAAQEISGVITFDELVANDQVLVNSDVKVSNGLVNGLNLEQIGKITAYKDETNKIESDLVFSNVLTAKDLHADQINDIDVNGIISHSISLDKEQTLSIPLIVEKGSISFEDDSQIPYINGILLSEYLSKIVNKHSEAIINGTKTFKNVDVDKNLHCSTVNGIDLADVALHAFSKTRDQEITGAFVVQEAEIENLSTQSIGGISLNDFVRIDEDTKITSKVHFSEELVSTDDIVIDGLLNGYDIVKLSEDLKTMKGNRHFKKMTVDGNVSWKTSNEEFKGFSFLLNQAVTINTPQTFTKKISFENGLRADSIVSEKWINNINLQTIKEDAVYPDEETEFTGALTFTNDLDIIVGSVETDKLETVRVNGVRVAMLDQIIVKKDSKRLITGKKIFENGFEADELQVFGAIDNVFPRDLVTQNDTRVIEQITFEVVDIVENLNFHNLENLNLLELLVERVTKDQSHNVVADITFENDMAVNECTVNSINGIEASDLVLSDSDTTQLISGSKSFSYVVINSKLDNAKINGFSFDQINSSVIRRNEDVVIRRPVIFVDVVHFSSPVNVSSHVNSYDIEDVTEAFAEKLTDFKETVSVDNSTRGTALALIEDLKESIDDIPGWFNYLEHQQDISPDAFRFRVEYSVTSDNEFCSIFFHKKIEGSKCGLPSSSSCFGRAVEVFDVEKSNLLAKSVGSIECDGVFETKAPSGSVYILHSEVVSFSSTCTRPETGIANVYRLSSTFSIPSAQNRFSDFKNTNGHPLASFSLAQLTLGYVSDVKSFTVNGIDYLVVAQFYDTKRRSHSSEVLVYKIAEGGLEQVDNIAAQGAHRLSLDKVDSKWILVIVNTEKEQSQAGRRITASSSSCTAESAIYFWNEQITKFSLIKTLENENPNDVVSLNVWNGKEFEDNFIGFSEKKAVEVEGESIGKISIYRYEASTTNYELYQIIDTAQAVSSLAVLSTQAFTYLVSAGEDGLKFYKYLRAEGFRNELNVPLHGAQDTTSIIWKDKILFPIAGRSHSILAKGVYSGKITDSSHWSKK